MSESASRWLHTQEYIIWIESAQTRLGLNRRITKPGLTYGSISIRLSSTLAKSEVGKNLNKMKDKLFENALAADEK
eukprot:1376836-Amorphochlora_amoeboformis.AAC.4